VQLYVREILGAERAGDLAADYIVRVR